MHKFLRAVGFSDFKKRDLEIVLDDIVGNPDHIKTGISSEGVPYAEFSKEYAANMGIMVRGTYESEIFDMEYYVPYLRCNYSTTNDTIDIEKHSEKESYAGICDDPNLGLTLIFYMQNIMELMHEPIQPPEQIKGKGVFLSGLSVDGRILLPVEPGKIHSWKYEERKHLISEARDGNDEAYENLAMQDMDTYSIMSKRIQKEDLLSIVTSYFMPYGIESDQYGILGEIQEVRETENELTKDQMWVLQINCNDLIFDVAINKKDLLGEPKAGRRFKGNIWMQGHIMFMPD